MRWHGSYLSTLIIGAVALASSSAERSAGSVCSFVHPLGIRFDSLTHAVVIPTPDTLEAGARGVRELELTFWESLREKLFGSQVHGQVASIVLQGGPGSQQLEEAFAARDSRQVLLVPWTLDGDGSCDPAPWHRSYRWLRPDSAFFVVGVRRAPRYWKNGRPVIDIPPFQYVYPGPWFDDLDALEVSLPGEDPEDVRAMLAGLDPSPLSPLEFFSLYEAMPTWEEAENEPQRVEQRLRRWEAEHPELLETLVSQNMLRRARAWVHEIDRR